MTLSEKQSVFACNVANLILWIHNQAGYRCTLGEAYRPELMAQYYAAKGSGIANSIHCKRLGLDINLFKDGEYISDSEGYRFIGEYWKSLHPDNRWGGDFHDSHGNPKPDGNHFSMQDSGVA